MRELTTYQLLVPPFDKGGLGGICKAVRLIEAREIPLNPPFPKGEADLRPCEQQVMRGKGRESRLAQLQALLMKTRLAEITMIDTEAGLKAISGKKLPSYSPSPGGRGLGGGGNQASPASHSPPPSPSPIKGERIIFIGNCLKTNLV